MARHACLSLARAGTWTLHDGTHSVAVPVSSRFAGNSVGMLRRLATLDAGIIVLSEAIVADAWPPAGCAA